MVPPAATPDFKRIKAKVGKRAPAKANVTDTSFRSTTLHVSHQSVESSRNNSAGRASSVVIPEPWHQQRQLHHPTPSVRNAAVQSLRHWIRSHSHTNGSQMLQLTLRENLAKVAPQLLLALAPVVCTDDDADVRRLAAAALLELVQSVRSSTSSSLGHDTTMQDLWLIMPFVPYLTALIATSLNALDSRQSWDGAMLVPWLVQEISSYHASLVSSSSSSSESTTTDQEVVWSRCLGAFIAPLTRLLADRNVASSTAIMSSATANAGLASAAASGRGSGSSNNSNAATAIEVTSRNQSKKATKKRKRSQQQQQSSAASSTFQIAPAQQAAVLTIEAKSPKQAALMAIHSLLTASSSSSSDSILAANTNFSGADDSPLFDTFVRPSDVVVRNFGSEGGASTRQRNISLVLSKSSNSSSSSSTMKATRPIYSLSDFPTFQQLGIQSSTLTWDEADQDNFGSFTSTSSLPESTSMVLHRRSSTVAETLSPLVVLDLLSKLRDCLVEATLQYKQQEVQSIQYIVMCAASIRLVLESNYTTLLTSSSSWDSLTTDMSKRLQKLCLHIGSSICESFPLSAPRRRLSEHSAAIASTDADDSNARLCDVLLTLAATLQSLLVSRHNPSNKSSVAATTPTTASVAAFKQVDVWIQTVVLHVQSALEDDEAAITTTEKGTAKMEIDQQSPSDTTSTSDVQIDDDKDSSTLAPTTSKALVSVLAKLLTLLSPNDTSNDVASLIDKARRKERLESWASLMDLFGAVFFPMEKALSALMARSDTGRVAAVLGCRLLGQELSMRNDAIEAHSNTRNGDIVEYPSIREGFVRDVLSGLPRYLLHWKADYLSESCICISTLQTLVRRRGFSTSLQGGSRNKVPTSLFDAAQLSRLLEPLFTTAHNMTSTSDSNASHVSILEQYPEEVQRQVLGLLAMLAQPTVVIVKALADICARSRSTRTKDTRLEARKTVTPSVASFITYFIHTLRKSIPMSVYIGFLIDGTGVMDVSRQRIERGEMAGVAFQVDAGVRDASSFLVQCGTQKVLPMLEALLTTLLQRPADRATLHPSSMIQARVALSLLAMFSWDLVRTGIDQASIFDLTSDRFQQLVLSEISWMLSSGVIEAELNTSNGALQDWIRPILSLFASETGIMSRVFECTISSLGDCAETTQNQVFEVWFSIVKSALFDIPKRKDSGEMIATMESLQSSTKDSSMDRHLGRLMAELKLQTELRVDAHSA